MFTSKPPLCPFLFQPFSLTHGCNSMLHQITKLSPQVTSSYNQHQPTNELRTCSAPRSTATWSGSRPATASTSSPVWRRTSPWRRPARGRPTSTSRCRPLWSCFERPGEKQKKNMKRSCVNFWLMIEMFFFWRMVD